MKPLFVLSLTLRRFPGCGRLVHALLSRYASRARLGVSPGHAGALIGKRNCEGSAAIQHRWRYSRPRAVRLEFGEYHACPMFHGYTS